MSDFIKQKAERSQQMHDSLDAEQRNRLAVIAAKIVEVQREITDEIKKFGINEICRICDGECCESQKEKNIFNEEYFLFLLLSLSDEVREEIMLTAKCISLSPQCMFFYHNGCTIPENFRPYKCKIWFCGSNRKMIEIEERFHPRLYDLFKELKDIANE